MKKPDEVAAAVARGLMDQGASAVVLMGSHARGDAFRHSDIDLIALGEGPGYRLERRNGHLVALSWTTAETVKRMMMTPSQAGLVVQGWRDACLLIDPAGRAESLRQRAIEWTWSEIADEEIDSYVAEELTGWAEEVHKLVNLLDSGNWSGAAVQRNILSSRVGAILAVHLRLLYASENDLWNLVADRMDDSWGEVQRRSFGLGDESFLDTCLAALDLYRIATDFVTTLLSERQLAVVSAACELRPERT